MRRLRLLLLLSLTAGCNLLFWLPLVKHATLRGDFMGYPNTAVVGSVAIVLLALLSLAVEPSPIPTLALHWHSLWRARCFLVQLPLRGWFGFGLWCVLLTTAAGLAMWRAPYNLVLMVLLVFLPAYLSSLLGLRCVTAALNAATLTKPFAWAVALLAVSSLVWVFAWIGAYCFLVAEGYEPSCSQRFVSPSGQRALVVETREEWYDNVDLDHIYVEIGWLRQELPNRLLWSEGCHNASLKLQWSADEKQVDWQSSSEEEHGQISGEEGHSQL